MKLLVYLISIIILIASNINATVYYVDATNGNDSSNGLSSGSAWMTLSKVNNSNFSPGDEILLKRGEMWRETLVVTSSGNSANPITFSSYGSGDKPIINGASIETGWSLHSTVGTLKIYTKSFANLPGVCVEDNVYLTYLVWDNTVSGTFSGASPGSWTQDGNTIYVCCTDLLDPDNHIMEVGAKSGNAKWTLIIQNQSFISINGLEFRLSTSDGILIKNNRGQSISNIVVNDCNVLLTGRNGICTTGGSENGTNGISNVLISNNTISFTRYHGVIFLYNTFNSIISNNTIRKAGWDRNTTGAHGISSWSNNESAYPHNNIIEHNRVSECMNLLDGSEGTGIQADDLTKDCTYRYNVSFNNEGSGLYFNGTSGCEFNFNICHGNGKNGRGTNLFRGGITISDANDISVYNNVFFNNSPVGIGFYNGDHVSLTIKNNIIVDNSDYEIREGVGADRNTTINYNCINHSSGGRYIRWEARDYNWDEWRSNTNQDANSINADPLFENAQNYNFKLKPNSPAINTGTIVGLKYDFNGTAIPQGGGAEIGAFEYMIDDFIETPNNLRVIQVGN